MAEGYSFNKIPFDSFTNSGIPPMEVPIIGIEQHMASLIDTGLPHSEADVVIKTSTGFNL